MPLPTKAALLTAIPLVVMTAIGVALLAQGKAEDGRSTLAVGVIVAAVAGSSVVYQVERWPLRTQSAIHFAIMLVTVLPALLLSGWFPVDSARGVLAVFGIFLVVGAVIWTVMFLIARAVERRRG